MPLRVSLVNLQKFTFHSCGDAASIRMLAPGAEHPVLAAGDDDRADLRVLEPQALGRVVELDVDAEVVGVQLELVAGDEPGRPRPRPAPGWRSRRPAEPPVPVAVRMRVEGDLHGPPPRGGAFSFYNITPDRQLFCRDSPRTPPILSTISSRCRRSHTRGGAICTTGLPRLSVRAIRPAFLRPAAMGARSSTSSSAA